MQTRQKIGVLLAEVFGTMVLTSVVLAQTNAIGAVITSPWFIAASAGLTLSVMMLAIGRVSGAHVNPAITVGLWTLKKISTVDAVAYIASQILGALAAFSLFEFMSDSILGNVAGTFDWRVFVAEMAGAFVFAFGVAASVTQKLEGFAAAFTIGTSLMLGALVAAVASHGILNPAVALGMNSWSWTYALAPVAGSVLGMNVYAMFLAPLETKTRSKK